MRWEVWLAYFAACWVIAVSPGSGAVLSMSHGLSYGLKKTSTTILGLQTGLVIILLIAGGGLAHCCWRPKKHSWWSRRLARCI
jgi:homoserine/homoserine lactone efflux protein